ncbi:putative sensor histidine kinase MtrB [Actinocatenispora thailandica]|uniref:Sensor histidine kinase MtrB n=1 Tax=Actinocatenispora thailandica TaxID=227318 RepID=A0A7R7DKF0_9ACTN|nr:MtrAB system histidine kinase MtrB [Actinocatenispora thailandica]BCJ33324.1 putative sensor histidine kinase MtrB [Actinocatenispora thailandica]
MSRRDALVRRARETLHRVAPGLGRRARRAVSPWRRSLSLRVVSITLLVSSLLVAAFGYFVAKQITAGLVVAKRQAAVRQVSSGATTVQQQLAALSGAQDPQLGASVRDVVVNLYSVPARAGTYEVKLVPDSRIDVAPYGGPATDQTKIEVPAALRDTVSRKGALAYQFTTADPDGQGRRPYLAVGEHVDVGWGVFNLYYLFPLDDEVAAANLVRNTTIIAGLALVLLLALMAAIVARMVVTPVRVAARTAQRLSAGLLHERMEVRGEDDLARLAASFNQMASNLQNQIVRLEELSRLQRRFTSDVSHELRTPLTTVRMAADMLYAGRDEFPPAAARSSELLADELDRFEALLTDLLEISRFDAGFAVLDAEAVDLVPIVQRVAAGFGVLAERLRAPVHLHTPDGPVIAEVDPRRVERVLRNLIGNAIEHGEHQPVEVHLAADERTVAIAVRDRGIGLRPGEEKLVFNRFWRADPSRARQTGGTGLGLSISLEDARLHGGWLEAWGAPGQGSQFRLTVPARAGDRIVSSPLPLVPPDADVSPAPLALPAGPAGGSLDDEPQREPDVDPLSAGVGDE